MIKRHIQRERYIGKSRDSRSCWTNLIKFHEKSRNKNWWNRPTDVMYLDFEMAYDTSQQKKRGQKVSKYSAEKCGNSMLNINQGQKEAAYGRRPDRTLTAVHMAKQLTASSLDKASKASMGFWKKLKLCPWNTQLDMDGTFGVLSTLLKAQNCCPACC